MSQLSENLKTCKLTFKSVLELIYEKDAALVERMIRELHETKPEKKVVTKDELEARKASRKAKKEYIDKFIEDNGGEGSVTKKQIQDEKKKYDKQKRASPQASPQSSPAPSPQPSPEPSPQASPVSSPQVSPVSSPQASPDADSDFELEVEEFEPNKEEPKKEVKKEEPKKEEPKKEEKKEAKKASKKKSVKAKKTPDTESDTE